MFLSFNIPDWFVAINEWLPLVLLFGLGLINGGDDPPPPPPPPPPPDPPPPGEGGGGGGGSCPTVSNVSRGLISVDQTAKTATYLLTGSYTGNSQGEPVYRRFRVWRNGVSVYFARFGGGTQYSATFSSSSAGSHPTVEADNSQMSWNSQVDTTNCGIIGASVLYFKSAAIDATSSTPTAPEVQAYAAFIQCNFKPNTLHSVCTAQLQYKKTSEGTWTNAGAPADTSGYNQVTISRSIYNLTPSTQYQVRLVLTRTTVNSTSHTSATGSFTTLAAAPDITTNDASSVSHESATLNATVDPNDKATTVTFEWDVDSGAPYANETGIVDQGVQTGDGNRSVSKTISGLQAELQYYFRAKASYDGGVVYGTEKTFTTGESPLGESLLSQTLQIYDFDRKYGVTGATSRVYFMAQLDVSGGGTDPDKFYTAGAGLWTGAGECKISKNGGAFSDTINDPVHIDGGLYRLDFGSGELQCEEAVVFLTDGTNAVRDLALRVRTHLELGSADIDSATGQKAGSTAFKLTGYQDGHGLEAVRGSSGSDIEGIISRNFSRSGKVQSGTGSVVRLDSGASSINDFYKGQILMIVKGIGSGQARKIVGYNGTTKDCTLDTTLFAVLGAGSSDYVIFGGPRTLDFPIPELSVVPGGTTDIASKKLQLVYQRFAFRVTHTSEVQTWFNSTDTPKFNRVVDDTAGVASLTKLADV